MDKKLFNIQFEKETLEYFLMFLIKLNSLTKVNNKAILVFEELVSEITTNKTLFSALVYSHTEDSKEIKKIKSVIKLILIEIKKYGFKTDIEFYESIEELSLYKEIIEHHFVEQKITLPILNNILKNKINQAYSIDVVNNTVKIIKNTLSSVNENILNLNKMSKEVKNEIEQYIVNIQKNVNIGNVETFDKNTINNIIQRYLEENKEKYTLETLSSGYKLLDKVLNGGFQKHRLYTIAGLTGFGKSIFLINILVKLFSQNKNVILFTLENTLTETIDRMISNITGIPINELVGSSNEIRDKIEDLFRVLESSVDIIYLPANTLTVDAIKTIVKNNETVNNKKYDAIIIDYLDLLKYISGNKYNSEERLRLTFLTRQLKSIAQELNVSIITATQLNRDAYKDYTKIDLNNISESSGKATDSDAVFILTGDKEEINTEHKLYLYVQKNRHGLSNVYIPFTIEYDKMLFTEQVELVYSLSKKKSNNDNFNSQNIF